MKYLNRKPHTSFEDVPLGLVGFHIVLVIRHSFVAVALFDWLAGQPKT